jgi:hypothetical protein
VTKMTTMMTRRKKINMLEYLILAIAVLAAIGLGLVYMVFGPTGGDATNCSGNCNQGRTCDCKGKK